MHIDESGVSSYGTLYLYDDTDTIRDAIKRDLFVGNTFRAGGGEYQDHWYGLSILQWMSEATSECYAPMSCRPDACTTCAKLKVEDFIELIAERINDPHTGHQYLFFEFDPLTYMFVSLEF